MDLIMFKLKTTSDWKDYGLLKAESIPKLKVFTEKKKWLQWQSSAHASNAWADW